MLADISPLSVPDVLWKKSDKLLGEDGPLLDTNDGGPLHTMPATVLTLDQGSPKYSSLAGSGTDLYLILFFIM